ncbi:pirin family protein, partial [Klebsiella michiganensis]|uniref:pirin family protein n=1 Tax=Klebsiella michiganensis TaxID=1134687 RepID=UPI0019131DC4
SSRGLGDVYKRQGYQSITADVIPDVELPNNAGHMRVIAGRYGDIVGPAHTFSPLNVWDLQLNQSQEITLHQPAGWSTALVVLEGEVVVNGEGSAREGQLVVLSQKGEALHLSASSNAKVLLMAGEPLQEPIVGYGPFVMNTKAQIAEAVRDFNSGHFGQI